MNNVSIFLNTKIEGSGVLSWIGDQGLAPVRYLFNGKTVRIEQEEQKEPVIYHIESFHNRGEFNIKRKLSSSSTSRIRAIAAVAFLIPGLVLSVFKLLAYVFSDVKERHRLAKEHFTPIEIQNIGSQEAPIATEKELAEALREFNEKNSKDQPVNALVIHGDGNFEINRNLLVLEINPMKLVLDRARLVHNEHGNETIPLLDNTMRDSGKWLANGSRESDSTFTIVQTVSSVEEALSVAAPSRGWMSGKRFHMVFEIAPQKV